jgi:hypothetical protein
MQFLFLWKGGNIIIGCPVSANSSLDYTCTLILGWKAFLEGQIISGMWTPRTQQKDQIDILEMEEPACSFQTGPSVQVWLWLHTIQQRWHTSRESHCYSSDFVKGSNYHEPQTIKLKGKKTSSIRVITKLPNSEQSYKGKVKTHKYTNRQNQSTTGKLWKP